VRIFRAFAWLYLAIGIAAILFYLGVEIADPPGEHLLPLFIVGFVGIPTSLGANLVLGLAGKILPEGVVYSGWFQMPLFLGAPLLQAWALLWLSRKRVKK
jgi:hypothetical protein